MELEHGAMDKTTIRLVAILSLVCTLFLTDQSSQAAERRAMRISGEVNVIGGSVSRSAFTEAVVNREPRGRIAELTNDKQFIYYFTELKGMTGQIVTHRWLFNGQMMNEFKFNVGSPRWRVWSNRTLQADNLGRWEVQVVNELGQIIHRERFNYIQASAAQHR
jgi:Protein of unknown function (DUF2914)